MEIESLVEGRLGPKRWQHVQNVAKKAVSLARLYGLDEKKAYRAGLLHDIAKPLSPKELKVHAERYRLSLQPFDYSMPAVLHAPIGSAMLKAEGIEQDDEVLEAVRYHTTGHPSMGDLAKVIYIADLLEEGRSFEGVDTLRSLEGKDLNLLLFYCVRHTLQYVLERKNMVHPDSIMLYNHLRERISDET